MAVRYNICSKPWTFGAFSLRIHPVAIVRLLFGGRLGEGCGGLGTSQKRDSGIKKFHLERRMRSVNRGLY